MLINNHQSLKAEIDAREENFAICINLGKALLERNHYRSDEVSTCIKSFNLLVHHRLNSLLCILSLSNCPWIEIVFCVLQVREKLIQLTTERQDMTDQWADRWEHLKLSKSATESHHVQVSSLCKLVDLLVETNLRLENKYMCIICVKLIC